MRTGPTFVGSLVLVAVPFAASPSAAAVLLCTAAIEGRGREAATELEARKAALADWHAKAGAKFTWRLARNKAIACLPAASGGVVCKAAGHPCTLHHKPPDAPMKRLPPAAPGSST